MKTEQKHYTQETLETKYVDPNKCLKIQWSKPHFRDGKLACPSCGQPAEQILGFFGNPCYGHVPNKNNEC